MNCNIIFNKISGKNKFNKSDKKHNGVIPKMYVLLIKNKKPKCLYREV